MQEASNMCEVGEVFWTMGLFCVWTICRILAFALRLSLPSNTRKEIQGERYEERLESCKVLAMRSLFYGRSLKVCETVHGSSIELCFYFGPDTRGPLIICSLPLSYLPLFLASQLHSESTESLHFPMKFSGVWVFFFFKAFNSKHALQQALCVWARLSSDISSSRKLPLFSPKWVRYYLPVLQ